MGFLNYLKKHWKLVISTVVLTMIVMATLYWLLLYIYLIPKAKQIVSKRTEFNVNYHRQSEIDKKISTSIESDNYQKAERLLKKKIKSGKDNPEEYLKLHWIKKAQIPGTASIEKDIRIRKESLKYLKEGMNKYPNSEKLKKRYKEERKSVRSLQEVVD